MAKAAGQMVDIDTPYKPLWGKKHDKENVSGYRDLVSDAIREV